MEVEKYGKKNPEEKGERMENAERRRLCWKTYEVWKPLPYGN
jgi:hypothetical protein